jgi:hypothetical protein
VDVRRDASKETFWRKTTAEACTSGQSVRAFCRKHGLKESLFYAWRRELKARDTEAVEKGGFVELVRPAGGNVGAGVSIRIDDRLSIALERGFDGTTLKAALAAVLGGGGQ